MPRFRCHLFRMAVIALGVFALLTAEQHFLACVNFNLSDHMFCSPHLRVLNTESTETICCVNRGLKLINRCSYNIDHD